MSVRVGFGTLWLLVLAASCGSNARERATDPPAGIGTVDVWLDPGHGGRDPGFKGSRGQGRTEKDLVLAFALDAQRTLEVRGFRAMLTREDDRFLSLAQRSRIANGEIPNAAGVQARGARFVSLHLNGSTPGVVGTETWWSRSRSWATRGDAWRADSAFATSLHAAIATALPEAYGACTADRSVREGDYSVLRRTLAPAALIELGFVSNPCQQSAMATASSRQVLADALALGIRYAIEPGAPADDPRAGIALSRRPGADSLLVLDAPRAAGAWDTSFDGAAFPPPGWALVGVASDTTDWQRASGTTGALEHVALLPASASDARDRWLASPAMPLDSTRAVLTFTFLGNRRWAGAADLELRVRRAGDRGWSRVWSLAGEPPGGDMTWRARAVDLAAFAGADSVQIAFRGVGALGCDAAVGAIGVAAPPLAPAARRVAAARRGR